MSSTVGNHGSGAQTLHSGTGSQSINAANGQLTNINKYYHFAINTAPETRLELIRLLRQDGEDLLSLLGDTSNISTLPDIANWLGNFSRVSQLERHRLILSQKTPGTGEWLLKSKDILDWETNVGQWLWIDGIIGAGKSTLASTVIDHLEKTSQEENSIACLYFYFQDDGDEEDGLQPTLESVYANLLGQLLRQLGPSYRISKHLQERFQDSKSRETLLSAQEYLQLLSMESKSLSRVYLVVDALDVCYSSRDPKLQDRFLRGIRQLSTEWNILITSRSGTVIGSRLESDIEFSIEASPDDMKLYIKRRIDEDNQLSHLVREGTKYDAGFTDQVCETVIKKAQGMFLLAKMHMDSLAEQHVLGDFRLMLRKLPDSRAKTFDAALQRIQKQGDFERRLAQHVLSWVACSIRPVTVDEVRHAFAIGEHAEFLDHEYIPSNDQLTSSCAGVIVIDKGTSIIRPAHDTILKHIRTSEFLPKNTPSKITSSCIEYLSLRDLDNISVPPVNISDVMEKYCLLSYATEHLVNYVCRGQKEEAIESSCLNFLKNSRSVSLWLNIWNTRFGITLDGGETSGLHACAYLGADRWAEKLLKEGMSTAITAGSQNSTPLHWAISCGNIQIVQLLVQHQAQLDAKDCEGRTPLHTAVISCCDSTKKAKLPLSNANLRDKIKHAVTFLIQRGADVEVEDNKGWTPLRWAIVYGSPDMVALLTTNKANVNRHFKDGWTALGHVAQHGSEPLALVLLQNNAIVDIRGQNTGEELTPLRRAIKYRHQSVAKLLLEYKADVNALSKDKSTALIQAARDKDEWATWLLLKYGAKVDEKDSFGCSALQYAVKQQQKSTMWLLVEAGASIDLQDADGRTALHLATAQDDVSMVWYLIEKGAGVNIFDSNGIHTLHLAAKNGNRKIMSLLIEHGAHLNQQDKSGSTALHYAVQGEHIESVRLLVDKLVDLDVRDDAKRTSLHHAASAGLEKIVSLLVEKNADAQAQDGDGLTALHLAVLARKISTTWILAKIEDSINIQDEEGKTALIHAAQVGDELATLCLMKNGADASIKDSKHWTACDYAAVGHHSLIVSILQ